MPEGDTIFRTATSLRRWLAGREITAARSQVPGLDASGLVGRTVAGVDARGKHLLIRFSGDVTLHTHMRMTGSWHVYPVGERWRKSARQARIMLAAGDRIAVCFNAPVVELMGTRAERTHPSLSRLGPDVLAPDPPDPAEVRRRARARAQASPTIGELLLDQQVVSGIGNIYRCESLFLCAVHPATPVAAVPASQLDTLVAVASQLMRVNATSTDGATRTFDAPAGAGGGVPGSERTWVYRRNGQSCRRCGTPIARALLGHQARSVYWCPACQPEPAPRGERPTGAAAPGAAVAVELRPVRPGEVAAAGELVVRAYRDLLGAGLDDGYAGELEDVAGRVRDAEVVVAVHGDRLVGCVTFVPDPTNPLAESLHDGEAGIRMLAVDPAAQGLGIGRSLTVACLDRAAALGRSGVFLHSTPEMAAAHHLYESLGFVRAPERNWQYSPGEWLLAFSLDLRHR